MARLRAFEANGDLVYDLLMEKKRAAQKEAKILKISQEIIEKKKVAGLYETMGNLTILNIGKRTTSSRFLRSIRVASTKEITQEDSLYFIFQPGCSSGNSIT